jgi:hypothetical protein
MTKELLINRSLKEKRNQISITKNPCHQFRDIDNDGTPHISASLAPATTPE